jgi:hypothetical protein
MYNVSSLISKSIFRRMGKDGRVRTWKRERMEEFEREEGKDGRVWTGKRKRMSVCGQGRGKGWQGMDGEEGKDGRVWTGKRERMAGYGRGTGNGEQSMDGEEGSMAELAKRVKGWQSVEREEGKDGKVWTGKREKISE